MAPSIESESGSSRIDCLAKPKRLPPAFFEDRRSVYWVDKRPLESNGHTEFALTARLSELARHKDLSPQYRGDRPTPIWEVSESAKQRMITARIENLARHKDVHPEFKPYRSLDYRPSQQSRSAPPSYPHLEKLAEPKRHKVWSNKDEKYVEIGDFCNPIWPVSSTVKHARCPERVEYLSAHKASHPDYKGERPVIWVVTDTAKSANATHRLQQLARPKSGRLRHDDYDPYKVTQAARLARVTPRVSELAIPIPRKIRQKKIV